MTRAQLSSPPFTGSWDLSASQTPGRVDGLYVRVDVLRRVSGLPGVPPPRITLVHLTENPWPVGWISTSKSRAVTPK